MRISERFVVSLLTSGGWWAGVSVSFILYLVAAETVSEIAQADFDYRARNLQTTIQARVHAYMDVLRGTAALFATGDNVSRAQFSAYVTRLDLEESFPGIQNINLAMQIKEDERVNFESAVRADTSIEPNGYPDFSITPRGPRPAYHVVTYVEPFIPKRMGDDISLSPGVDNALALSRDTGQLISSARLPVTSGAPSIASIAMRMPLYKAGMPLGTVQKRRAAYLGSVGLGIDIKKLLAGVVDDDALRHIRLKIYDAGCKGSGYEPGTTKPEHLLFDSNPSSVTQGIAVPSPTAVFKRRVSIGIGSRFWEIELLAYKSEMIKRFDTTIPLIVLLAGLLSSLLFYAIYYSFMSAHRRATELASEMTKGLRASETSLAEAQHMARLGSWTLEPVSGRMTWSGETFHIFGMNASAGTDFSNFLYRVHEEDRSRVQEGLKRAIATDEEFAVEHRIVQRNRDTRWVQTICRARRDGSTPVLCGTMMDITEHKHMLNELKRSHALLRHLTAHQDRIKEEERKRIAREIHDELGQTLLALRIDVSMLATRTAHSHPKLNARVREALQHLDSTVKTIRTIINNLRPAVLDLGLGAAIEWQVAEFSRRSGISCNLAMTACDFDVDNAIATTLFRILQESLTNVLRHARATEVKIELDKKSDMLMLKIADNGVGIQRNTPKAANAFGLVGIEERVLALNGKFSVTSSLGAGTTLSIMIPLPGDMHDDSKRAELTSV